MAATVNRVSATELQSLDAKLHQQEILNIFRRLKRVGAKSIFELKMIVTKGTTPTTLGFDYKPEGLRFIRSQNVLNNELTGNYLYINADCNEAMKRSIVKKGDVLTNIVGASIGRTAVYNYEDKANTNQAVAIIKSNNSVDSHYLSTWMNSNLCLKVIAAQQSGNARDNFDLEQVRKIEVPLPDSLVQKYIGDKVRQAEQLRALAKVAEMTAKELFDGCVNWSSEVLNVGKINIVSASELDGRLDLKYNSPARLAILRHIKNKGIKTTYLNGLVDISAMIGWKGLTTEYYTSSGPWLLRGVEFRDGVIEFENLVSVDLEKYLEQPQIHLKEGDIAFSKDGTIGKAIVIPELSNDMAAGSTIARLRPKKSIEINPYYLELALNHDFVQVQVESFATGIAQPHITQEWIAQLVIPRVKDEESIGESLKLHHLANNHSKKLIRATKTLVEALIEGQLTEQQLIQAHQALDDGDNSLDQAILSKLSSEGYALEGAAPLFSDIDELYSLLENAAQAEAEE